MFFSATSPENLCDFPPTCLKKKLPNIYNLQTFLLQCFQRTKQLKAPAVVKTRRYYALVALQSPQPSVRVAGLSMLTEVRIRCERWEMPPLEGFLPWGRGEGKNG